MQPITIQYRPRGAAYDLFSCRDRELMSEGPAGTGKTTASLMKLHIALLKYPNARALILRKTHASLRASALVTFNEKILHPLDGVRFFGGSGNRPAEYRYPNKAVLVASGIDTPEKHKSTDYDLIYVNEATDLNLEDWESLTTRLRNNVMPYQQLIGDCNPTYPEHWLNKRMQAGMTTRYISRHEDNPMLFDDAGNVTPNGTTYMAALDALTGVRYLRLRKGIWAAAEGTVYQDAWDSAINLIDRFTIPREWPRFLSIDFGFTHAFVTQWWAQDPDGRIYLYREIYKTKTLVEDHAKKIIEVAGWNRDGGDPLPYAIIRDHDAEDGATLERHLRLAGIHVMTTRAIKNVSAGINASAARMRKAGDGKPRLYILRDSLVEIDRELQAANLPYCTLHEFDSYVWNEKKDAPVKESDHGCFVAGTMISTISGLQPIETIAAGQLVLTRQGYKRVLAAGMTQQSAKVMRVTFSDGRELIGTPDHPVYVEDKGFISLDTIRYGDIIRVVETYGKEPLQWQSTKENQRSSSTKASPLGVILRASIGHVATITDLTPHISSAASSIYMSRSGKMPMDLGHQDTRYTTRTAIRSIILSRILNASQRINISKYTAYGKNQKSASKCAGISFLRRARRLGFGMARKKGLHGIGSWGRCRGRMPNTENTSASIAVSSSSQGSYNLTMLNIAAMRVRRRRASSRVLTMSSAHVDNAVSCLPVTAIPPHDYALSHAREWITASAKNGYASIVEQHSAYSQQESSDSVACHACTHTEEPLPRAVYNLTVEDASEYFANGVLVHNCDAMRYVCQHLEAPRNVETVKSLYH